MVAGGFLTIVGVMVGLLAMSPDPTAPYESQFSSMVTPPLALETVGQCGGTFEFDAPEEFSGVIPEGFFDNPNGPGTIRRSVPNDPMIVPAYGYFLKPQSAPTVRFIASKDIDSVPEPMEYLGYMWDGWSIIWYDPDVEENAENAVKRYIDDAGDSKVMAMPWNKPQDIPLPLGRHFGFSAWETTMSCELWDARIADKFLSVVEGKQKSRNIDNPHVAKPDHEDELPKIAVLR